MWDLIKNVFIGWRAAVFVWIKPGKVLLFEKLQGERGHSDEYYTSPQSFMITFSYSLRLINFGDFYWILIGWFIELSVINVIYKRGIIIEDVHKFIGHCLSL